MLKAMAVCGGEELGQGEQGAISQPRSISYRSLL